MDNELYLYLVLPCGVLFLVFLCCLYWRTKIGKGLSPREKRDMGVLVLILIGTFGCFFFFKDQDVVFDCRKETSICVYQHSTMANGQLREAGQYDFSGAKPPRIEARRRRSRHGYYGNKYYKVVIETKNGEFAIPYEFDLQSEAMEQAGKFSEFLMSDKPRYVFKDIHHKGSEYLFFVIIGSVFIFMISSIGLSFLFIKKRG